MAKSKADSIEGIQEVNPATVKVDGEEMEIAASAVQSVTTQVPSDADASSDPGPYDVGVDRPPVSTNRPNVPIAASLVAGAGAPSPKLDYHPEDPPNPDDNPSAYVSSADKDNVVEMETVDDAGNVNYKDAS